MKKSIVMLLVLIVLMNVVSCQSASGNVTSQSVRRDITDQSDIIYIEDGLPPLGGSIENAAMSEQERARAAELKQMASNVLTLVNRNRVDAGLNELVWSEDLESAALYRAQEIVTTFSHTRPDGSDWWTVNSEIMYGENLGKGYKSASKVMDAWMKSPTHKENILFADFVTIGIAIYEIDGKLYWVQEFGY